MIANSRQKQAHVLLLLSDAMKRLGIFAAPLLGLRSFVAINLGVDIAALGQRDVQHTVIERRRVFHRVVGTAHAATVEAGGDSATIDVAPAKAVDPRILQGGVFR